MFIILCETGHQELKGGTVSPVARG